MSRLWLIYITLLGAFVIAAAGHYDDNDIEKPMKSMQKEWNRRHASNSGRQWEMMHFKIWISSNVHRRFVFSGFRLRALQIRIQAVMSAKEVNLTVSTKLLVSKLKDSGAPKEDVKNFVNVLKKRCKGTAHPPTSSFMEKQFFKISVPATYDGALSACHAKGGSLALLASAEEAKKAWGLISTHKDLRFYVMARSLPEHFRQMYPQLLGNEMDSMPGPNVKCLTMNPKVVNQFVIGSCGDKHGAMCEKYNLASLLQEIGVKGFVYYNDRVTLQQAKKTCASIGGALATINNGIEQKEAFEHLEFHGNRDAFIDASKGADREWYWSDRKAMKFKKWGPSANTPNKHCAVMERRTRSSSSGQWRSVLCASRNAFLCEVRVIPDRFVRLNDRHAMGKYFVGHSERMTHSEGRERCGQLAKIRSKEQLAAAMLAAKGIGRVHIGLSDHQPGKFVWNDNSAVDEELLDKQMVGFNARDTFHRCVVMDEHGRWLTASCNEKAGYLCEESYQKKPMERDSTTATFEMDVRYNIPFSEVTRKPEIKEAFIKAAEASILRGIYGKAEDVTISGLKSGSTIVTYRFYTSEIHATFEDIKEAIKNGRVVVYFNGRKIRVTDKQDYNFNPKMMVNPFYRTSFHRRYLIIGAPVAALIFIAISIVMLICCIKKRKYFSSRIASVVDMKTGDPEKKGPPPDDEPLPSYKELEANAATQPPPYFEPVGTPPPAYVSEMPEVKT